MSYKSDWLEPKKLGASLVPALKAATLGFTSDDLPCLLSLFFDNLATIVGVGFVFINDIAGAIGEKALAKDIMSKRIYPAIGIMLFLGNFYMSWMASRMKEQYGRDFTAQPYGINTVGAFPFLFGIMLPTAFGAPVNGTDVGTPLEMAWKAGCTGNFVVGLINVGFGLIFLSKPAADFILTWVPVASFVIPVAGVGLTWLALNQIAPCFAYPAAGYIPVFMIFVMYWSNAPIQIKNFKIPLVLHWVLPGLVGGLAYSLLPAQAPDYSFDYPGGGVWAGGAFVQGFSLLGPYMGTVIPIAIAATMSDVMCLVGAYNAGDPYPISETMIVDGIFTIIGSILGSPFGTVIYFGHPVHKRIGGKYAYSFINGVIYLLLCLIGIFQIIVDISPKTMIGPTIMVFGVMLAQECTRFMPRRHHGIIFFTLFFAFCDYSVTQYGIQGGGTSVEGIGVNVMAKGALLSCMIWSGMLSYAMDNRWLPAAAGAGIGAVLAFFGLIHNNGINFDTLMYGSIKEIGSGAAPTMDSAHWAASCFQTAMGYLLLVATCLAYHFMQTAGSDIFIVPPPIMPGSKEAEEKENDENGKMLFAIGKLDDWWAKGPQDPSAYPAQA